jgi:hypothetical protein
MTAVMVVFALAAVWCLGACTLALLDARGRGAAGVVADYIAGVAILGCVGMIGIALGAGVSVLAVYVLLVAAAAASRYTGAWRRLPRPSLAAFRLPSDRAAAVAIVSAAVMIAVVLTGAMQDRLWWDGWSIWMFKAKVLFEEGTLPAWFTDPRGIYETTNLDYPLALPLLEWWVFRHVGAVSAAVASFAGAVWYALLPALAWSALRGPAGARLAGLAALGLAAFWPISFFAAGGTADVVIAIALLGALIELTAAVTSMERAPLIRAAAYLSLGALTKNEGLALALIALPIAGGAFVLRGERRPGRLAWLAVPLLMLAPWRAFIRSLEIGSPAVSGTGGAGGPGGDRLEMFLMGLRLLITSSPWMPIALLVVLGVWALLRSPRVPLVTGWVLVGFYFAALALVYLRSSADMLWLLSTSAPRVFGALVPGLVYLSVLSVSGLPGARTGPQSEEIGDAYPI